MSGLASKAFGLVFWLAAAPAWAQSADLPGETRTPTLDLTLDYGALEQDGADDGRTQSFTGDPDYTKGYADLTSQAGEFEFAPIILDRRQDGGASETGLTTPFGIEWKKKF